MNNNVNEPKQSELRSIKTSRKINLKTAIIIGVIIIIGALLYAYKGYFVAATVNGSPISRFAVTNELEKTSGKQTLDSLITQKLIVKELDKQKITVTNDEINADEKKIEDQITAQGGTLDQALAVQGMTITDLRDQISINLRIEKLLADKIQVSDDEISQYIKDNKLTAPKGQEAQYNDQIKNQLISNKFDQATQDWVDSIRSQASIRYFVNY